MPTLVSRLDGFGRRTGVIMRLATQVKTVVYRKGRHSYVVRGDEMLRMLIAVMQFAQYPKPNPMAFSYRDAARMMEMIREQF